MVADALSQVFEGQPGESPEMTCAVLLESLLLVYCSIEEHQTTDPLCTTLRQKIKAGQVGADNFQIHTNLLCFFP